MDEYNWITNIMSSFDKDNLLRKHLIELMRFFQAMFKYNNLPDTLESRFLELYLQSAGSVVVGKIGENIYCVPPNLCGDIDAYNLGTTAFGVCPIGRIEGTRGIDVVWGLNNKLAFPTVDVYDNAVLLTEIDLSIKSVIINSRYHNIPIATDNKTKVAIDSALENSESGIPHTVLSHNVIDELNGKEIRTLSLTDVNQSDKIQYLFHAKDDIYRQLYNRYGQTAQGTSKMAQQSVQELEGGVSWVSPYEMLQCRIDMCNEINRIFGTNINVEYSEPWQVDFSIYAPSENENLTIDKNDEGVVENEKNVKDV